nr:hypothetical protein L204_01398 [Cryptococcus depauperatus CBS 7855]
MLSLARPYVWTTRPSTQPTWADNESKREDGEALSRSQLSGVTSRGLSAIPIESIAHYARTALVLSPNEQPTRPQSWSLQLKPINHPGRNKRLKVNRNKPRYANQTSYAASLYIIFARIWMMKVPNLRRRHRARYEPKWI